MKYRVLLFVVLCAICFSGCKKDDWMDWKAKNQLWLEQNKLNPGVQVSPTGLQYKIIADPNPTDARPSSGSRVYCDYRGTLINGVQFDGGTGTFAVSGVVAGFAEGLKKIHCHGDIEIYVPYELGYKEEEQGTEGTQSYIPPYSTLIFNVHIRAVQ
jgi:FKBP-type peptidyl-prolyl cis-trans isomerase